MEGSSRGNQSFNSKHLKYYINIHMAVAKCKQPGDTHWYIARQINYVIPLH